MITHALFSQTATRLNCLENMFETTVIRGKCYIFDKLQSTCLRSWSRSLPTPILRPPETEPQKPRKSASFRQNVGENKHPGTKSCSAPCLELCAPCTVPSRNNKQGHHFQNTYSRTSTPVSVVLPVNVRLCAGLSGHLFKFQTFTRNHFFPVAL